MYLYKKYIYSQTKQAGGESKKKIISNTFLVLRLIVFLIRPLRSLTNFCFIDDIFFVMGAQWNQY
jgi:hypothetical protein